MKTIFLISFLLMSLASSAAEVCVVRLLKTSPKNEVGAYASIRCTEEAPLKLELYIKGKTIADRQLEIIKGLEEVGYQFRNKMVINREGYTNSDFELVFVKN
jgi:hypothetical protein